MYQLKPEYQKRLDECLAKPYVLTRVWNFDSELDTWKELEIARSKSIAGLRAYIRLKKLPNKTGEYRIKKETVELINGWYPSYDTEFIEEI